MSKIVAKGVIRGLGKVALPALVGYEVNDMIDEENRRIATEIVIQKILINEKITEASDNKELFYIKRPNRRTKY